jgi:hypothetical protein
MTLFKLPQEGPSVSGYRACKTVADGDTLSLSGTAAFRPENMCGPNISPVDGFETLSYELKTQTYCICLLVVVTRMKYLKQTDL